MHANVAEPVVGAVESTTVEGLPDATAPVVPLHVLAPTDHDCAVATHGATAGAVQPAVPVTARIEPLLPVQTALSVVTVTNPIVFATGMP